TATPVPTFSRAVRDSAYAMPANGSTSEPNTISDSHSESTPSSSKRSTASPNTAGTAAEPSEIPILTFIPPSDHARPGPRLPEPAEICPGRSGRGRCRCPPRPELRQRVPLSALTRSRSASENPGSQAQADRTPSPGETTAPVVKSALCQSPTSNPR